MSLLHDERGQWSSARCAFWAILFFTVVVITGDVFFARDVENAVYAILTTCFMATASWAAGPRIAQYLAPQIAAATKAVGEALKRRDPKDGIEETK